MTVEAFAEFAGAEFGLPLKTLDFSVQGARFVEESKEVGKRDTGMLAARTIADLDIKHAPILMALSASRISRSLPPVADADVARVAIEVALAEGACVESTPASDSLHLTNAFGLSNGDLIYVVFVRLRSRFAPIKSKFCHRSCGLSNNPFAFAAWGQALHTTLMLASTRHSRSANTSTLALTRGKWRPSAPRKAITDWPPCFRRSTCPH